MIKLIKKLVKAVKVTKLLDQAWSAVAVQNVDHAEACFAKIDLYIQNLSAEHQIMKAYVKFKASKYMEAGFLFDDAWTKINSDPDLSDEEKLYFKGYILGPSEVTLNFLKYDNCDHDLYKNIEPFDLKKISLDRIAKKWKIHFPVKDHPDWDKYGI